jgi:hypothetical protein
MHLTYRMMIADLAGIYMIIKGPQGAYIHVNKQLILTIKINNIHADKLILSELYM